MLDPFLGIGNSAIAAKRSCLTSFIGFEIDEKYLCEVEVEARGAHTPRVLYPGKFSENFASGLNKVAQNR